MLSLCIMSLIFTGNCSDSGYSNFVARKNFVAYDDASCEGRKASSSGEEAIFFVPLTKCAANITVPPYRQGTPLEMTVMESGTPDERVV